MTLLSFSLAFSHSLTLSWCCSLLFSVRDFLDLSAAQFGSYGLYFSGICQLIWPQSFISLSLSLFLWCLSPCQCYCHHSSAPRAVTIHPPPVTLIVSFFCHFFFPSSRSASSLWSKLLFYLVALFITENTSYPVGSADIGMMANRVFHMYPGYLNSVMFFHWLFREAITFFGEIGCGLGERTEKNEWTRLQSLVYVRRLYFYSLAFTLSDRAKKGNNNTLNTPN